MKRFSRWMMAGITLFVAGIWISSAFFAFQLQVGQFAIADYQGTVFLQHNKILDDSIGIYELRSPYNLGVFINNPDIIEVLPAGNLVFVLDRSGQYQSIICAIWIPFLILSVITLKLCYHPFKTWWQGTDRKGFEVEMKSESKDHGQDANATDQSVKSV